MPDCTNTDPSSLQPSIQSSQQHSMATTRRSSFFADTTTNNPSWASGLSTPDEQAAGAVVLFVAVTRSLSRQRNALANRDNEDEEATESDTSESIDNDEQSNNDQRLNSGVDHDSSYESGDETALLSQHGHGSELSGRASPEPIHQAPPGTPA